MKSRRYLCNRVLILLWMAGLSSAQGAESESYFWDRERGWFWYEPIPEKAVKAKTVPKLPATDDSATPSQKDEIKPWTVRWVREQLPHYLDQAIDDPTPEHVRHYFRMQRWVMDKSEQFSEVARTTVQFDPQLDETSRRPLATFAVNAMNQQGVIEGERLLKQLSRKSGILFFYQSECQFCHLLAPILKMLEMRYGFTVYPVSLDDQPLPGGYFEHYTHDRGQAALLGVRQTPSLFLMRPPGEVAPLGQGVLSLEELTQRILLSAFNQHWISEQDYRLTQGVRAQLPLSPDGGFKEISDRVLPGVIQ